MDRIRQEEIEQGETLARKALALDPATTSAYLLLAAFTCTKDGTICSRRLTARSR